MLKTIEVTLDENLLAQIEQATRTLGIPRRNSFSSGQLTHPGPYARIRVEGRRSDAHDPLRRSVTGQSHRPVSTLPLG